MRHWKKIALSLAIVTSLTLALVLWIRPERAVSFPPQGSIKKALVDLGAMRLGIPVRGGAGIPRQFYVFEQRQRIREAGFDPVWKGDRYILRNIENGEEIDPFISGKRMFNPTEVIDEDRDVRTWISPSTFVNEPNVEFVRAYFYHLKGFDIVLRDDKLLYVTDVRDSDAPIPVEQWLVKYKAVYFNVCVLASIIPETVRNEEPLRRRGYIMKKTGDGYVPVSLETGAMPPLPPKELYINDAITSINSDAKRFKNDYLAKRRFQMESDRFVININVVEKEVLDLYGVEIRWNEVKRQYELVE